MHASFIITLFITLTSNMSYAAQAPIPKKTKSLLKRFLNPDTEKHMIRGDRIEATSLLAENPDWEEKLKAELKKESVRYMKREEKKAARKQKKTRGQEKEDYNQTEEDNKLAIYEERVNLLAQFLDEDWRARMQTEDPEILLVAKETFQNPSFYEEVDAAEEKRVRGLLHNSTRKFSKKKLRFDEKKKANIRKIVAGEKEAAFEYEVPSVTDEVTSANAAGLFLEPVEHVEMQATSPEPEAAAAADDFASIGGGVRIFRGSSKPVARNIHSEKVEIEFIPIRRDAQNTAISPRLTLRNVLRKQGKLTENFPKSNTTGDINKWIKAQLENVGVSNSVVTEDWHFFVDGSDGSRAELEPNTTITAILNNPAAYVDGKIQLYVCASSQL